jgi:hypothetical protein
MIRRCPRPSPRLRAVLRRVVKSLTLKKRREYWAPMVDQASPLLSTTTPVTRGSRERERKEGKAGKVFVVNLTQAGAAVVFRSDLRNMIDRF